MYKRQGIPDHVLQLLPGKGSELGHALTSGKEILGVAFTGSTGTAKRIAKDLNPRAFLLAETGGLNAMIVDSTALPEQTAKDVIASAFQSAGQRCSALRCLYVQEDIFEDFTTMLSGMMDELVIGDPAYLATDVGPVITQTAKDEINAYITRADKQGRLLKQLGAPKHGFFVGPALLSVAGIEDLTEEVFGPVLHVARYAAKDLDQVINAINASGYGLTFGLHTRIDQRADFVASRVQAGNIYINRNQIGAVVGSQPFGGEGLSGTGPKAGGPLYVSRFCPFSPSEQTFDAASLPKSAASQLLPGPTGERNELRTLPRGPILCLGPGDAKREAQIKAVRALGVIAISGEGQVSPHELQRIENIHGVVWWGSEPEVYAQALAKRKGPLVPLITTQIQAIHVLHERHICTDTAASGGNADLLSKGY